VSEGAVPIPKGAAGGNAESSDPTIRFNPKTGVAALNATAYRMLGQPAAIGVWYNRAKRRVCLDTEPPAHLARKLSPKRTFAIAGLREFVPRDGPRRWVIWQSQSDGGWVFDVENAEE
jgi:PAS domain-containing protein